MPKQAAAQSITAPLGAMLSPAGKKHIEMAIQLHLDAADALMAFLDETGSDPDLEPSLASCDGHCMGATDDREKDDDLEPDEDGEAVRQAPIWPQIT